MNKIYPELNGKEVNHIGQMVENLNMLGGQTMLVRVTVINFTDGSQLFIRSASAQNVYHTAPTFLEERRELAHAVESYRLRMTQDLRNLRGARVSAYQKLMYETLMLDDIPEYAEASEWVGKAFADDGVGEIL